MQAIAMLCFAKTNANQQYACGKDTIFHVVVQTCNKCKQAKTKNALFEAAI